MDEGKLRKYPPAVVIATVCVVCLVAALRIISGEGSASALVSETQESTTAMAQAISMTETPVVEAIVSEAPAEERVTVATEEEETGQQEAEEDDPEAQEAALAEETALEEDAAVSEEESTALEITAGDAEMLMRLAMAEAEGESVEGKALVMLVVLNRVRSEAFPDTVEAVIFQTNQFSVTVAGGRYWTREPDEGCREALELVKQGWDESQGALYFESSNGSSWHSRNLEFLFQEGNHRFYR